MRFAKAHSLGNDFLYVEEKNLPREVDLPVLARHICDRHRGVGADGLVLFRGENGRFAMRVFNCDGSEAEMSGNGLRALGACLRFSGRVREERIVVETVAGARVLELLREEGTRFELKASMGAPQDPVVGVRLDVDGRTLDMTILSMGNPHAVLFVDPLDFNLLRDLGQLIERHPRFPNRTNVEFVHVLSRHEIAVGFWERGVGETGASGTGSSAAAVAAILNNKVEERVSVKCPGGVLEVSWPDRKEVFVVGEAILVAEGEYLGKVS